MSTMRLVRADQIKVGVAAHVRGPKEPPVIVRGVEVVTRTVEPETRWVQPHESPTGQWMEHTPTPFDITLIRITYRGGDDIGILYAPDEMLRAESRASRAQARRRRVAA